MARRRLGRRTRSALASAAVLAALSAAVLAGLPAVPALAKPPADPAIADSTTPHLDAVEQALREVSPGLEGSVWQRTGGNSLDAPVDDRAGWLLQTPGCWGDHRCAERPGTQRLLATMTGNIAKATRTVDISTLAPLPDGVFQDAIVAGLRAAATGHKLRVRVLVGAAPVAHLGVLPWRYRDELNRELGFAAANITLNVASMTTSQAALSWNHSKILVVDGATAIVGGINDWTNEYVDTAHPVSDVDIALSGPAAGSAARYLDTLWTWTCRNRWNVARVWFASSGGAGCLATLEAGGNHAPSAAAGTVPVIAVGGLGVGIQNADPASAYRSAPADASDTRCGVGLHDYTNADRDYDTVNPEQTALRALIASASRHVEISQQDLNARCPPLPRYDVRLYDILAAKLAADVKVRVVVSDPANRGPLASGYSQIRSLSEISDTLRDRIALITRDQGTARTAMCRNLQLASFRQAPEANWADGHPYPMHHKLIVADGSAFYVGSKNLYPAWLQDFGYIVENRPAAAQVKANLLDPEWRYSRATATVDYERGICAA